MYACLLLHLNNGTDRDLGSLLCSCSRFLWLFFMGLASILRSSILCAHPSINSTLYLLFAAFPIVYQQQRGWSPGVGNLAFIGKRVHHKHVFVLISAYRCCGRLCDWSLVLRVGFVIQGDRDGSTNEYATQILREPAVLSDRRSI
jgi:hypothetical protein